MIDMDDGFIICADYSSDTFSCDSCGHNVFNISKRESGVSVCICQKCGDKYLFSTRNLRSIRVIKEQKSVEEIKALQEKVSQLEAEIKWLTDDLDPQWDIW